MKDKTMKKPSDKPMKNMKSRGISPGVRELMDKGYHFRTATAIVEATKSKIKKIKDL